MVITNISRTYSRSINARTYGMPESWIRIESTYEAQCESSDDPRKVSEMLYEQAKKEVVANVDDIVAKIKEANEKMRQNMQGGNTANNQSNQSTANTPRPL